MAGVTGLLLAAGSARRFGAHKILALLPNGEAVGVVAARGLAPAVERLCVVLRAGDEAGASVFAAAGYRCVACVEAELGMAHSLACGLRASSDSAAWVVALGDMPYVESATVAALVARFRQTAAIVIPRYGGREGHPVVFPARYRDQLMALRGDRGGRAVIERALAQVQYVDTADPGVLCDIDQPSDLAPSPQPSPLRGEGEDLGW